MDPSTPKNNSTNTVLCSSTTTDSSSSISKKGRPKRGRKRTFGNMSRDERKSNKYKRKEYVNSKKQKIADKKFIPYSCECTLSCSTNISENQQKIEFDKFSELGSYVSQNLFIAATVKEVPVKRKRSNVASKKQKQFSREYYLNKILVCRNMFIKTLGISTKRINTSLVKMRTEDSITDKRGTQGGWNKLSEDLKTQVIEHIQKFPKYISHYSRAETNSQFLPPEMTLKKMFELYLDGKERHNTVSFSSYKKIFYRNFNLKFKTLKKDTCNKCDTLNIQKKNSTNDEEKEAIVQEHNLHISIWQEAKMKMKQDMKFAADNRYFECLTYDLEKTLPLPRIPTNIVFYKRQLWVYNCGIHSGKHKRGFCYPWVEGTAGRGAQEVGSCLLKHIKEHVSDGVTDLVLWSDSCGGQNRNIKIVLMLKCVLESHPTIQKITMRYLISGHSYLPNDDDFGKIESALKHQQYIYIPEDYFKAMETCRKKNPLVVRPMQANNFFGIADNIEKNITNRKKGINGEEISWLKTREIILLKEKPFSIFFKQDFNGVAIEVDITKKTRGRPCKGLYEKDLNPLWPQGKGIAKEKLKDLKSMWHLIPKVHQAFYSTLFVDETVVDDIDGFGGILDFEAY